MVLNIYTVNDLKELYKKDYIKTQQHLPLSPLRIKSHLNNPRASGTMPVIFTMEEDGQIIAYRSLLPDYFVNDHVKTNFAWLSGNFVAPEYRRQGISTKLFRAVEESWDGKLMFTNYAPASKAVYEKTGKFKMFQSRPGKRYYLKSALYPLLKERVSIKPFLKIIDNTLNFWHDSTLKNNDFNLPEDVSVEIVDQFDKHLTELIDQQSGNSLFSRSVKEFNWIKNNPWITADAENNFQGNYQFTWQVSKFQNRWYKIKSGNALGFLWTTIVDEKFSIPYYFSGDKIIDVAARQIILNEMIDNGCTFTTTRNPLIGPLLGTKKNPFLYSRKMPQHYFAHESLAMTIPSGKIIHDGDGDCVFT